jgi:hypothetical protein
VIVPTSAIYVPTYGREIHNLRIPFVKFAYKSVRLVPWNVKNTQTMPNVARLVPKPVENVLKPVKCKKLITNNSYLG